MLFSPTEIKCSTGVHTCTRHVCLGYGEISSFNLLITDLRIFHWKLYLKKKKTYNTAYPAVVWFSLLKVFKLFLCLTFANTLKPFLFKIFFVAFLVSSRFFLV